MTVDYANKEQIAKFLEGGIDFMYRHLGGSPPLRITISSHNFKLAHSAFLEYYGPYEVELSSPPNERVRLSDVVHVTFKDCEIVDDPGYRDDMIKIEQLEFVKYPNILVDTPLPK